MKYTRPYMIAEAGCNHMGDMKTAKSMIDIAAGYCHANAIKFQKRCNRELLSQDQYNALHPNAAHSYGKTYGEHREFLEFTVDQHRELKMYCEQKNIVYSSSVWDITSAKEIASLRPAFIKIPSASNTHWEMLRWLCQHYEGEIQLSFGMTTHEEEEEIIRLFTEHDRNKDLVIFSCTSGYPVSYPDICLGEMTRLINGYGTQVKGTGFSGHHLGIAVDIAAYTLGAIKIERHFTLDKTWKGTDHAASLEPDEMRHLVDNLGHVNEALRCKSAEVLPVEQVQRNKLKYKEHT